MFHTSEYFTIAAAAVTCFEEAVKSRPILAVVLILLNGLVLSDSCTQTLYLKMKIRSMLPGCVMVVAFSIIPNEQFKYKNVRADTITKIRLYNFDPLKPHFYIIKLWFTGSYISFLILLKKHSLWVLVRIASPWRF